MSRSRSIDRKMHLKQSVNLSFSAFSRKKAKIDKNKEFEKFDELKSVKVLEKYDENIFDNIYDEFDAFLVIHFFMKNV